MIFLSFPISPSSAKPIYHDRGHVLPDAHDPQGSYCVAWSVTFGPCWSEHGGFNQQQFLERYHGITQPGYPLVNCHITMENHNF